MQNNVCYVVSCPVHKCWAGLGWGWATTEPALLWYSRPVQGSATLHALHKPALIACFLDACNKYWNCENLRSWFRAGVSSNSSQNFLWAPRHPALAPELGSCSLLAAQGNVFQGNHADLAGGLVYATDLETVKFSCSAGLSEAQMMQASWSALLSPCSAWLGNWVGQPAPWTQVVSAQSFFGIPSGTTPGQQTDIIGYGATAASPPFELRLSTPEQSLLGSYASNGQSKLEFMVNVYDQTGNVVTPGHSLYCQLQHSVSMRACGKGTCKFAETLVQSIRELGVVIIPSRPS